MKTVHARSLQLLALVTCAWMLTMTGCIPGGGASNNEEASGPLTPERFVEEYQQLYGEAFCRSAYQCPKEQSQYVLYIASIFENEPTCRQRLGRDITKYNFPRAAQFELWTYESGLAEFDRDAARACLDDIQSNISADACLSIHGLATPPSCYDVAQGVQPNGADCNGDAHCQSGFCEGSSFQDATGCSDGTCAPDERPAPSIQAVGEPCNYVDRKICDRSQGMTCDRVNESDDLTCVRPNQAPSRSECTSSAICAEGLGCSNPGDESFCYENELNAEGEACALGDCQPGLVCANTGRDRGPYYTCERPAALGEPCFNSFECQWDLYCEGEVASSEVEGTCAPRLNEGDTCGSRLQCETGLTCSDETCVAQGEACGIAPAQ